MSGLSFTCDPALAQMIRKALRAHVAERNARDYAEADQLDETANEMHARAADLRGEALERLA